MSDITKDNVYGIVEDWLIENGWKDGDGFYVVEGRVFIYKSGDKVFMPDSIADLWKLL